MRRLAEDRSGASALIVASSPLADLVAVCLHHTACRSEIATSTDIAREQLSDRRPDLLVVDLALDGGAAINLVCARAGSEQPATIALVGRRSHWSSLDAFSHGADQVVTVPFTPDELAVRAFALLRTFGVVTAITRTQQRAGLVLNIDETVRIGDRTLRLTPGQNSLLFLLASRACEQVSFDAIREFTWGGDPHAGDDVVARRVGDLGRVLPAGTRQRIEAVEGGFILRMS